LEHLPKIVAAAAFLISMSLGLASGARIGLIIVKAAVFTVVFFGLAVGIRSLFEDFLAGPNEENGNKQDAGRNQDAIVGQGADNRQDAKAGAEATSRGTNVSISAIEHPPPGSKGKASNKSDEVQLDDINSVLKKLGEDNDSDIEELGEKFTAFKDETNDTTGLEQNNKFSYNPVGGDKESSDLSTFIPGFLGSTDFGQDESSLSSAPQARTPHVSKTVEVSVAKKPSRSIELSDLGQDVDGKRVASAIQTLLKKDEG
jgi:hypothetical protein